MATRGSAVRRIPGNPLGGVLRATARAARSTTRRSVSIPGPQGEAGPQGECGAPATVVAAALTSDVLGVARWDFEPMDTVPLLIATPVADVPVFATLREASECHAEFLVWHADGTPWTGATVHVAAFPLAATPGVSEPETAPPVD